MPVQPALRPLQAVARRRGLVVRVAEDEQRRVAEEHEPSAGPQQPRRLGDPAVRVDPDRRAVLRERRGRSSRRAGRSRPRRPRRAGTRVPVSPCMRRAVSSCAGVMSTPTGRAPRRASHEEKYAVPQPSSTTSSPSTSPSTPTSDSGTSQMPHSISSTAHASRARASVYSAFDFVQVARFFAASSDQPIGEPQRDLALGGLGRVRPVDEVVRHRERELAAQRAGIGVGRIGRADRLARGRDRALALEHERERRPRGDEVDELAEERLLAVLGVVLRAELARSDDEPRGADREAAALEARRGSRRPACARRRRAWRG